jgi:glycogen debranching enzyme
MEFSVDEAVVTQQYYIATKSPPVDDRARVLKYGSMFAVFDRLGDIQTHGLGEQGIFFQGTRHLSEFSLRLWRARPLLLSSNVEASNFMFRADLANLDVSRGDEVVIPRGTLHVQRSKFLWHDVCYEELEFVNHGLWPLVIPVRISFDSDFVDIFEVRGMHRARRGTRQVTSVENDSAVLSYEGLDGVVRETSIRCDPPPKKMSATEADFTVLLDPKGRATHHISICCDFRSARKSTSYSTAVAAASDELQIACARVPRISSSNSRFNDWMTRSMADIHMMTLGNREEGYPYAGVPWFSTVFGRDGIITALQLLWLNSDIAKGVLRYLASTQATEVDHENEAEPGKIIHEMRRGEMAALREVPFARYYGSVDATPLYVVLAGAYFEHTGDLEFVRELWPSIDLALRWIDQYGDLDGDGFVEYASRAANGLIQQGWKDSNDSVFHADGTLAEAPIALCEVQGYVYAAKVAAVRLCHAMGNHERCTALQNQADKLFATFNESFWCEELATYALALDGKKRPCRVRTSNAGHSLYCGIVPMERAALLAQGLQDGTFFSGWGIRTVATSERRYNPLSYHNGSIWPHDNALIASGLARYGRKDLAGKILLGLLDVSSHVDLHRLPELFCGLERRQGEGPTLYPVACAPQAWAAGAAFQILQGCLGLRVSGARNRIEFSRPYLPDGIPQLSIEGWRVGTSFLDLLLERRNNAVLVHVTAKAGDMEVVV